MSRTISILAVILAVIMGVLALALPAKNIETVVVMAKFFDVMLPVLGVGALLKYLMK